MARKSKKSRDSSTPLSPVPSPLSNNADEEDNEITADIVAAARHGDQQAIDRYLSSFPAGYRFAPLDYELIEEYLYKKIKNQRLPINNIIETDIYKHNPYDLAARYKPQNKDDSNKKWYFITPRDRKYPNGDRPNRAAGDGYWKATGADTTIEHNIIGKKKTLVFYIGKPKPPGGVKTKWIMYEYRIEATTARERAHAGDMRLDDYTLVRIHEKKTSAEKDSSPKAGGRSNKAPKENARNNVVVDKAPKAKRIKAAVDHTDCDNNQIVAVQSPPIENKATVDQITSMNNPPSSNCDLLSPVSNITSTNYDEDGLHEVGQLLSTNSALQNAISDLLYITSDSGHLVPSTLDDSVYQGYQGNQHMGPVLEAGDLYNNSDGLLEGRIPDASFYQQCYYFNSSSASQTDGWFPQPYYNNDFIGFQTMSNVNGIFTDELKADGDLPMNELPETI